MLFLAVVRKGRFTKIVLYNDPRNAEIDSVKEKFTVTMHRCSRKDTFDKYGYSQMCQFACKCDGITYGDLKNIGYYRTQTLGIGGSFYDFRFYKKKEQKAYVFLKYTPSVLCISEI